MSFCGSWASSDVGFMAEMYGGPLDGKVLHLVAPVPHLRLTEDAKPIDLTEVYDDTRPTRPVVFCYHRKGNGPYWGKYRYEYHGSV